MNFRLLIFLFFASISVFSQRTVPNPIILVHGYTASGKTWTKFTDYLKLNLGLSVSPIQLKYDLNCDNNIYSSKLYDDVCEIAVGAIGNYDVYVIDFEVNEYNNKYKFSNQAAAVKQGYALKLAVARVLAATGADRVTMLGHSMGGLAIREYVQNKANYQSDGEHHVAKMATIGTPHGGSDLGTAYLNLGSLFGKDETSEAARDLKTITLANKSGVYLFGGVESSANLGQSYKNLDINCNGILGDNITGLNQKGWPRNVEVACIVGGISSDLVVTTKSQNMNNFYTGLWARVFNYDCSYTKSCHNEEPEKALSEMVQALDDPEQNLTALKNGEKIRGVFAKQTQDATNDDDEYVFPIVRKGVVDLDFSGVSVAQTKISITDPDGKGIIYQQNINSTANIKFNVEKSGNYKVSLHGQTKNSISTYFLRYSFCPYLDLSIISEGNITFCEGQNVNLIATAGYDEYKWFKDGVQITSNSNQLSVNQTGTFTVQASKCGITSSSTNYISTTVKPIPIKPIINKDEQLDQFLLTSSSTENNQWFLNGNLINGAIAQTYIPQELGVFTVRVLKDGCSNISEVSNVKMDKPTISLLGSNPICDGDSLKLVAPTGFGGYIFSDGAKEIPRDKNELIIKKAGKYYVATKRGKFISNLSDPITIKVNPNPPKPTVLIENTALKSSSPINNQWYLGGISLQDSTGQYLKGFGSGAYTVKVTENGCFSESDAFVITGIEPKDNNLNIKLYPNPNESTFWVELPQTLKTWQIDIFDIQGRLIFSKLHGDSSTDKEKVELKKVSGSYIMRVTTARETQNVKFIVE